jgi:hypothetical protein
MIVITINHRTGLMGVELALLHITKMKSMCSDDVKSDNAACGIGVVNHALSDRKSAMLLIGRFRA